MHGFEKFVIYNDESVDRGLDELKPFIDRGIVEVKANWTVETLNVSPAFTRNQFKKAMTIKALLESNCKNDAIAMGYDYYASLDIDEYVIPKVPGVTVVDAFSHWFNGTGRSVMCLEKFNFQSTPHILEPVNLLTIEAYQIRMKPPAKMNYYTSVSPKCMYRMNNPDFTNTTAKFIAECCHFHGCQGWDFRGNTDFCKTHFAKDAHIANGKGKKWAHLAAHINHYSRSLEKFGLKAKTWKTATGEAKEGENSEQAAKGYDIPKFLQRSVGWTHDATAIRYTCQLREVLKNITGADPYLRPGDMWYRNAEFGKSVGDPDKRGRYGRPNPPGFKYKERNPYHYHGVTQGREMI